MDLTIVVALARNYCIGVNNTLPWRQSADLKQFKARTTGHPMIMGRKTFDSIGKPLPGRKTVVVTRQVNWRYKHEDVVVVHSLEDALKKGAELANIMGVKSSMLVGGADLYAQALQYAQCLHVTHIDADIDGDAFFPEIAKSDWRLTDQSTYERDEKNQYGYRFCTYIRQS